MNAPDPEHPDAGQETRADAPRFVNWLGFLLVGMLVNGLFVWGMWDVAADPAAGPWVKTLSWLPFNFIATMFYLVCYLKLTAPLFRLPALAMIAANWIVFFAA
ncbi:MAG: hypothetical protein FJ209_02955 [Betaproteobacteria bacterium]|nr:hypothetical protein [Betaproteobacteria bacterium]